MKKRLLVVLVCAIMVMALLPTTAFADNATTVWIGGLALTDATPYYHNGANGAQGTVDNIATDAAASFQADSGTLTLDGLAVSKSTAEADNFRYAIYANGDLTLCLNGDNRIEVDTWSTEGEGNTYTLFAAGDLNVTPGSSLEGALTASSLGVTANGTGACYGIYAGGTLTVSTGAALTGSVTGTARANKARCVGLMAYDINVTGGTLKGQVSGTAVGGSGADDHGLSYGIMALTGDLTLTAGSVEAASGNASGAGSASYGFYAGDSILISDGSFTAKCGEAQEKRAANCPLSLGDGLTALGSTSNDGSNSGEYRAEECVDYQWISAWRSLTVTASPSGNVAAGTAVTLTATPANSSSPTYQWYSNGTNQTTGASAIAGATSATYAPPTDTAGTIYYFCKVNGDATSNIVDVTVSAPAPLPPIITAPTENTNVTAREGDRAVLSVTATNANGYQWEINTGTGFVRLPGATASSCALSDVRLDQNGSQYRCVVSNSDFTATSPVFTLQVTVPTPGAYTVTFDGNGGVSPAARNTVNGRLADLPAASRNSYRFTGWYTAAAGGTRVTADTVFAGDTTVYAHWSRNSGGGSGSDAETVYPTTEGTGGRWMQGASRGCSFTFNAPLGKFRSVRVDETMVDTGSYDKREGSTIITLHADYLATLSVGTHTLRVNFTDGYAETSFTVSAAAAENPDTGGTNHLALWTALLLLSGGAIPLLAATKKRSKAR